MSLKKVSAAFLSFLIAGTCFFIPASQAQAAGEGWITPLVPSAHLGQIVQSYQAPDSHKGLVVFLEDLHFNRSVQRNIEQLIHFYSQSYPTAPVGVEGAAGPLDYTPLSNHYKASDTKDLVNFLVENGEITGSEAYAMLENQPKRLIGVENERYYQYHLQLFRQSYRSRMALHASVVDLLIQLTDLRRKLNKSDRELLARINETSDQLNNLEALLAERVTLNEAKAMAQRLPQTLGMVNHLESALSHPVVLNKDQIEDAVQASIDFYAAALLRDEPIAINTLQLLGNQRATLLVAGGFHVAGVTQALQKAGVSYVVVMPTLREHTSKDDALYVRRLMGGHMDQATIARSVNSTLLGVTGDILQPGGVATVDSWSSLRRLRGFGSRISGLFLRLLPGRDGEIKIDPTSGQPLWTPGVLRSEKTLYEYTRAYVQYRVESYGRKTNSEIRQTADLTREVTAGDVKGTVASEASSDVLSAGLNPSTDLAVAPIDITFKSSEVTAAEKENVIRLLLQGKILHQFIMAGEASRMKKSIRENKIPVIDDELDAMYFLDLASLNESINGSTTINRTSMWGPRQILQIHYLIKKLAEEYGPAMGISVQEALDNQYFEIHTNAKADERISADFKINNFYGFSSRHIIFTPQHVDAPFELIDGKVRPAHQVDPVALGNGWPLLESAMPRASYQIEQGRKFTVDTSALTFFAERGVYIAHQYRINDLYNLSPDALDIESLAKEVGAIQSGRSSYVVRMVANPKGTKGGIPLEITQSGWTGAPMLLADTLAASDLGTKAFLAQLKTSAPYHRFANTYDVLAMLDALSSQGLAPDFELKKFPKQDGSGDILLINPQYVAGMLTMIKNLKAITIHVEGQPIRDLKDLTDLGNSAADVAAQDAQPGFGELANTYLRPYPGVNKALAAHVFGDKKVMYRPSHVLASLLIPLAALIGLGALAIHRYPPISWSFILPSFVSLWSFGVGLSKEIYVISRLSQSEGLHSADLARALVRAEPVEEFNQVTGEVKGVTGIVSLAHTARSHSLFENEVGAHGLDLVTVPLQAVHAVVTALLWRFFPRILVDHDELLRLPLMHALLNRSLASLYPSDTVVDARGDVFLPSRQSSLAGRLQQVFFFNPQEKAFLKHAREQMASAA